MSKNNSQNNNHRKVTLAGVLNARDQAKKSNMYVVWSEGKPVSILKAKRGIGSLFSSSSDDKTAGTPIPPGTPIHPGTSIPPGAQSCNRTALSSPASSLPSKRKPISPTSPSRVVPHFAKVGPKCPVITAPSDGSKVQMATQPCPRLVTYIAASFKMIK